ncbi:ABC-2 family transporter protein [Candidatus Daviesbacteria bacterium]|nr:ABC-2 family transporter protein [Candidatus Daviesbacteria bacterium]
MSKYWAVFNINWQQGLAYRLNFFLWRVRSVLQLLLVYFLWWTVFQNQTQVFGYTQASILTYIIVATIIRTMTLSSRVIDVAGQINEGSIANFLLKPLNFIGYFFARDIADKLLNILFVIVEITVLIYLLKPPLNLQTDWSILILFMAGTFMAMLLYFLLAFVVGLLAFWMENAWGPYFLLLMFIEGLGGGIFPIDILPKVFSQALLLTPFPYLIYFPSKLYLGTMAGSEILQGFLILSFWALFLWFVLIKLLHAGFKKYTASGY